MSKWRPATECLYVIPDIHGQYQQLELILSRILPLRKTNGVKDTLVFLGDYIDRGSHSIEVVNRVIELQKEYGDQIVALMGNHELMILDAIKPAINSNNYLFWTRNGGVHTLESYLKRAGYSSDNPYIYPRELVKDLIPKEHLDFFKSRPYYYETEDFIFVHGGLDPLIPLKDQENEVFAWDRSLYKFVSNIVGEPNFSWEKCIVTGHNGNYKGIPLIHHKFMMLDCSKASKLLVIEMNSMEGYEARKGKKRLVKFNF